MLENSNVCSPFMAKTIYRAAILKNKPLFTLMIYNHYNLIFFRIADVLDFSNIFLAYFQHYKA